jgi:hypothetical protein
MIAEALVSDAPGRDAIRDYRAKKKNPATLAGLRFSVGLVPASVSTRFDFTLAATRAVGSPKSRDSGSSKINHLSAEWTP